MLMGFTEDELPEPFGEYVDEAISELERLCNVKGAVCYPENIEFADDNSYILIEGRKFGIGKTVAKELRNTKSAALFICTAGQGISLRSQEMLTGENPVLGYIYDALGSMIVENAANKLQEEIRQAAYSRGLTITNRYSPGYCNWSVADQSQLFSFFPPNCCGISLTDSFLMHPIKSVSGLIGMGEKVKFREYTCDLCSQTDCFHRNYQKKKQKNINVCKL
jgi:hypothetical protein